MFTTKSLQITNVPALIMIAVLALATYLTSCRNDSQHRSDWIPTAPECVTSHTGGTISARSPIRVFFADAQIDSAEIGRPVDDSAFEFRPPIRGQAAWRTVRELVFTPDEPLPSGQHFGARLDLGTVSSTAGMLVFEFAALEQSVDVYLDGLTPVAQHPAEQIFTGHLFTADVADDEDVEAMFTATQDSERLDISWEHEPNLRLHTFDVLGIVRQADSSAVILAWNGAAIGAAQSGVDTIAVPAMGDFRILEVKSVQGDDAHIEIRFSDPIETDQDFANLIELAGKSSRISPVADGNVLRIHSSGGWRDTETVTIAKELRSLFGFELPEPVDAEVHFEALKPQVRFADDAIILPTTQGLTIPIEVVNLRAVVIKARHIREANVAQFLQVNDVDGDRNLNRVGRIVWKKEFALDLSEKDENRSVRCGLDVTELVANHPGGLYRLEVSFGPNHIIYDCPEIEEMIRQMQVSLEGEDLDEEAESSFWDSWAESSPRGSYRNRHDPCSPAYYRSYHDHKPVAKRNVLISDIGLIAKRGRDDKLLLVATNLRTAEPLEGASVVIGDYQGEPLATGVTNHDGIVEFTLERKPFLATVRHAGQTGYLKLDSGTALSVGHFDVSGVGASKGLKGFLYGERGVWRPGDDLHLTFILWDENATLPGDHPVRFELTDSRGNRVKTITRTQSVDGFYDFRVATAPDAPTGFYIAKVSVGGATFTKKLPVETIMPNRLKIACTVGEGTIGTDSSTIDGTLAATWLHGAVAGNLRADIQMSLQAARTRFPEFSEYTFDDPTRECHEDEQKIFGGTLDENGEATFQHPFALDWPAPGMLTANLSVRVFEPGGAFSVDRFSVPVSPLSRYVGIRTPKGDTSRGMLLTDEKHEVDIVLVDPGGNPVDSGTVRVSLHKIDWRWWWSRGQDNLTRYADASSATAIASDLVELVDGHATWEFEINHPSWGRYLILARDTAGGHRTGKAIYIDWPGWAGRARKDAPGGAAVLTLEADKQAYIAGEEVTVTIPTAAAGRALVSIESGSKVIRADWVKGVGKITRYTFTATEEMAPNVYVNVTFLQPHLQTLNDLPIRMYGVIPIKVSDPRSHITPVLDLPEVFAPNETATFSVREASGRAMTYTVAIVDNGLLGLTRFRTPDPWHHFYQRQALGVTTWDVYDDVAGAYGAVLDRLLAVGGDGEGVAAEEEAGAPEPGESRAKRFPPMVRFLGPFTLAAGETRAHEVDIPQYLGSVRAMVVAGHKGAFGHTEADVYVRKPLMVLPTLPRVVGPEELIDLPVAVFALEDHIKDVTVTVKVTGPVALDGPAEQRVTFSRPGDATVRFRLETKPELGVITVETSARCGAETTSQTIELDVRVPGSPVTDVIGAAIEPGGAWDTEFCPSGMAGTNRVVLELSVMPPIDLEHRLRYLIRYPHGCVEQTTSSVFPQLYLKDLLELKPSVQREIESNIKAAIKKLGNYRTPSGAFTYWPVGAGSAGRREPNPWVTNFVGHFLVEAKRAGYRVPESMLSAWRSYQEMKARQPSRESGNRKRFTQAYRLYTLALSGAPDLTAMNRLRESLLTEEAAWRLAAAYQLAGESEVARAMTAELHTRVEPYRELSGTYGSDLRDLAMILETLVLLGDYQRAKPVADEVAGALSSGWHSTQSTAYALISMARFAAGSGGSGSLRFKYAVDDNPVREIITDRPIASIELPGIDTGVHHLKVIPDGEGMLFARLMMTGVPPIGTERPSANGMKLIVEYFDMNDEPINPGRIEQGTDFMAHVTVVHSGQRRRYDEIALCQIFPSGWEIRNERMDPALPKDDEEIEYQDVRDDRVYSYFDLRRGQEKRIETLLHASYTGRFYLPLVKVEAMYDATISARAMGQWVEVVAARKER